MLANRLRGICCASRSALTARSSTARWPMSVSVPRRSSRPCGGRGATRRPWSPWGLSRTRARCSQGGLLVLYGLATTSPDAWGSHGPWAQPVQGNWRWGKCSPACSLTARASRPYAWRWRRPPGMSSASARLRRRRFLRPWLGWRGPKHGERIGAWRRDQRCNRPAGFGLL